MLDLNEYVKLLFGLIAISTPLAALPVYVAVAGGMKPQQRANVALVVAVAFSVTLILFAIFGRHILAFFGISIPAFRIAGGLLLVLSALRMLAGDSSEPATVADVPVSSLSVAIVPLTIPILAGPGAITMVMVYAHDHDSVLHKLLMGAAIATVSLFIYLLFRVAVSGARLGDNMTRIMNQVMGLIIASIGVEFVLKGISHHFKLP
jgi:multiple antibiotic resistance protein